MTWILSALAAIGVLTFFGMIWLMFTDGAWIVFSILGLQCFGIFACLNKENKK